MRVTETQTSWFTQTVQVVHVVTINALLPCPLLLPPPHFFFLTLVIYILPISSASYMISKLIINYHSSSRKKNSHEAQLFHDTGPFPCFVFYSTCAAKPMNSLWFQFHGLMNFVWTIGSKRALEYDKKVPGFEEPVELRSSSSLWCLCHRAPDCAIWSPEVIPSASETFDFQIHEVTDLLAEQYLWLQLEDSV